MRLALIAATLIGATAAPALAQSCMPYAMVAASLANGPYAERLAFRGMVANGTLVEIWVNVETGTWTAISVIPAAEPVACALSAGEAGTLFPAPLAGEPS